MSRLPKRAFTASFVVSIAALPTGCPAPHKNPPPPRVSSADTVPQEPATQEPTAQQPSPGDQTWNIVMREGTCFAHAKANCPTPEPGKPIPTCNPPPPIAYACPEGMNNGDVVSIILRAGGTECFANLPAPKCPPTSDCNPPAPRQYACPK
jgi:hypothetical protein